jgi:hypothetical protein
MVDCRSFEMADSKNQSKHFKDREPTELSTSLWRLVQRGVDIPPVAKGAKRSRSSGLGISALATQSTLSSDQFYLDDIPLPGDIPDASLEYLDFFLPGVSQDRELSAEAALRAMDATDGADQAEAGSDWTEAGLHGETSIAPEAYSSIHHLDDHEWHLPPADCPSSQSDAWTVQQSESLEDHAYSQSWHSEDGMLWEPDPKARLSAAAQASVTEDGGEMSSVQTFDYFHQTGHVQAESEYQSSWPDASDADFVPEVFICCPTPGD